MLDADDVLSALRDNLAAIESQLDEESFRAFDERRKALGEQSAGAQTDAESELVADGVATLLAQFPAAAVAAGIPEQPAGQGTAAVQEEEEITGRDTAAVGPVRTEQAERPFVTRAGRSRAAAGADQGGGPGPGHEAPPRRAGRRPASQPKTQGSRWTPQFILDAIKESVAALIGLGLVGFTGVLAYRTASLAGNPAKLADSKDVLQLMLGLAGVVLGYYFGRVPAEARATQAQAQAAEATQHAQRVRDKGEELADQVEAALTVAGTRGGGEFPVDLAEIRRLRAELRALARLS
jgi:hypothetical protein